MSALRTWLARDGRRALVAGVLAMGVAVPWLWSGMGTAQPASLTAAYLILFSAMFGAYAVLTVLAFAGRPAAALAEVVAISQPDTSTRRARLWNFLSAADAHAWGMEIVVLSLGAVLFVALRPDLRSHPHVLVWSIALCLSGWSAMAVAYACAYLRLQAQATHFAFPGDGGDTWGDFVYLSLQIQTTFAGSDVAIVTARARRLVTIQSLLSFAFSTVVVALLVSLLVGIG